MTNSESLDLIETAIADTDAEIKKLDSLTADAMARQETVRKLETELADIRANAGGLEPKVRNSRHVSGQSLLTLERVDLAAVEHQITAQVDRVIQFSLRAIGLLQEL